MKITQKIILIAGLFIAGATAAEAHAFLDHAEPRVGSTVKESPALVKIWFTEELEEAFSKIQVFDAGGKEVDQKNVKVDPANQSVMSVSVPKLSPGIYKVVWNAVAVDTHHTTGTFTFEVTSP
jgi:methionine-rich copper-binding protein CopC